MLNTNNPSSNHIYGFSDHQSKNCTIKPLLLQRLTAAVVHRERLDRPLMHIVNTAKIPHYLRYLSI